ncbi:MAG: PIG-L family deacetylase [Acidobacteria bacterium]|nr:PIG-L family deacetylase [Acidobacteriota bacterium]
MNRTAGALARVKPRLDCGRAGLVILLLLLVVSLLAQTPSHPDPIDPLPQDAGAGGLKEMLLRLHTTARLLHTTAHPDDEDGAMLTLESRGEGVTAMLLTLNRGEGGQNKVGSNLSDVLGVLRTLELAASDRYYGVEQRFTRVADFGFSKNPEETFEQWQGHDIVLGDMVRVIRSFRPDVIVSRFGGSERDGHGNHQASGIISKEAFRAAADAKRFPDQIKSGLLPWQAKKLYIDNVCPFRSNECDAKNYTLRLSTGDSNSALGTSYADFAMEGLKHQLSQGAGVWSLNPGPHYAFYKLIESDLSPTTDNTGHERDYWDGIDTSLPGLADRLAGEEAKVPFLRPALQQLQEEVERAVAAATRDPESATAPLIAGLQAVRTLERKLTAASVSEAGKNAIFPDLVTKEQQFEKAVNLAAGISLKVSVNSPAAPNPDDAFMAVPGQSFKLDTMLTDHGATEQSIVLDLPAGWKAVEEQRQATKTGGNHVLHIGFHVQVPAAAEYTRPYWHRDDPETQSVNIIDDPRFVTLPFPPPPVRAHAAYTLEGGSGTVQAIAFSRFMENGVERERAVAVAPAFSIALEPGTDVISTNHAGATQVNVGVRSNIVTSSSARLRLDLPSGWKAQPEVETVTFQKPGQSKQFRFKVTPADLRQTRHQLKAVLDYEGKSYTQGYTVITRPDLDTFYYYQPAIQRVSIVDLHVLPSLKVGYIMGAGDDIPTVLKQIGIDVSLLPPESLASDDLSGYGAIILGIRTYDTQKDVIANNKKLLDYVANGGTLMVQYETGVSDFNSGHFTPYQAELSRARVSVEQAPVAMLAPDNPVFHYPNQITLRDFEGWVQERGLYFMDHWDDHFQPLLSSHDPGEPSQDGGLLIAQYGKGTYIYNAYAFFRQLPAGVPGAIRLYVNLLSAGKK